MGCMWERRGEAYIRFCWGNLKKEKSCETRHTWEDNNKMDPYEVGCGCVNSIEIAQDRDR